MPADRVDLTARDSDRRAPSLELAQQLAFARGQHRVHPFHHPAAVGGLVIDKQAAHHLELLDLVEAFPDFRQHKGFFAFQVVVLGDAQRDHGLVQVTLGTGDHLDLSDLITENRDHFLQLYLELGMLPYTVHGGAVAVQQAHHVLILLLGMEH